jgi:hypothetical protein
VLPVAVGLVDEDVVPGLPGGRDDRLEQLGEVRRIEVWHHHDDLPAAAGRQVAGEDVGPVSKLGDGMFDLCPGDIRDPGISIYDVRNGAGRDTREVRDVTQRTVPHGASQAERAKLAQGNDRISARLPLARAGGPGHSPLQRCKEAYITPPPARSELVFPPHNPIGGTSPRICQPSRIQRSVTVSAWANAGRAVPPYLSEGRRRRQLLRSI